MMPGVDDCNNTGKVYTYETQNGSSIQPSNAVSKMFDGNLDSDVHRLYDEWR